MFVICEEFAVDKGHSILLGSIGFDSNYFRGAIHKLSGMVDLITVDCQKLSEMAVLNGVLLAPRINRLANHGFSLPEPVSVGS